MKGNSLHSTGPKAETRLWPQTQDIWNKLSSFSCRHLVNNIMCLCRRMRSTMLAYTHPQSQLCVQEGFGETQGKAPWGKVITFSEKLFSWKEAWKQLKVGRIPANTPRICNPVYPFYVLYYSWYPISSTLLSGNFSWGLSFCSNVVHSSYDVETSGPYSEGFGRCCVLSRDK